MASSILSVAVAMGLCASMAHSQAIIGDGNVILGVANLGYLNVPYKGGKAGLPRTDPLGIDSVGLRNPKGDVSAVEQGCLCESWGAGIRKGSHGEPFLDECGAEAAFSQNVKLQKFTSSSRDASSTVLCGKKQLLKVRHQFRSASHRPGCKGAYEVKVSIENRSCKSVRDVIYRRVMDWDIDPTPFNELVTIQGDDASIFESATNNGFCSFLPSETCDSISGVEVPFVDAGPFDHGAQFQVNLGELKKGESVIFRMYYGYFRSEKDALRCVNGGAKINLYSLGQDRDQKNTFMFGFRSGTSKVRVKSRDRCIDPDARAPPTPEPSPRARSFASDDVSATEGSASGEMSQEDKQAMNHAAA